jgi:hypothetical protein
MTLEIEIVLSDDKPKDVIFVKKVYRNIGEAIKFLEKVRDEKKVKIT